MKRIVIIIILALLCQGCALMYLNMLANKCATGKMKEGEIAAGNTQVRIVCKDGKLQRIYQ